MYYNTGKYKLCYICILLVRVGQFTGTYFQNIGLFSQTDGVPLRQLALWHFHLLDEIKYAHSKLSLYIWSLKEMITEHMFHIEIKWFQKALALFRDCISAFSFAFKRAMIQKCKIAMGKMGRWWKQSSKSANINCRSAKLQKKNIL